MPAKKRPRGEQRLVATNLQSSNPQPTADRSFEFGKVIALWLPRQFLVSGGVDVLGFVSDINRKINQRGIVLWDGQVLKKPITDISVSAGILIPEPHRIPADLVNAEADWVFTKPIPIGKRSEVIYEGAEPFEAPPRRDWGTRQQSFFGLEHPYQMAEDAGEFTYTHLMTRIIDPYLAPNELIAGLLHGERDDHYFYCPCHSAEVVYTTHCRFVCMGCGATHLVLAEPLLLTPKRLVSAEEWIATFTDHGPLQDDEIDITIVDFQDIENASTVWITDQWEDAKHRFVFFARSSPEVIQEAIRGTEMDPSIFAEAGWKPVDMPPPPAFQVAADSINLGLLDNCLIALSEGVDSFLNGRRSAQGLTNAIPQLFRAIELALKARLEELDETALNGRPNTAQVLKRIGRNGVRITDDEIGVIDKLRILRNDLQHGKASFNHRAGLSLCRRAIVFLDSFLFLELRTWIGGVIAAENWQKLLEISDIQDRAKHFTFERLNEIRQQAHVEISRCQRCGEDAMVRPHPNTGASCLLCRYVPITASSE